MKVKILLLTGFNYDKENTAKIIDGKGLSLEEAEQVMNMMIFFTSKFDGTDIILLITPTTPTERIKMIDEKSSGFVYCVSVTGITGAQKTASTDNLLFIKNAYEQCTNNRVLVGFGISSVEDVKYYKTHCDGVIEGSAVIKSLMNDDSKYQKTLELVRNLKSGLIN